MLREAVYAVIREAWELARDFARATCGQTVNLYAVDSRHAPVPRYESKMIRNR